MAELPEAEKALAQDAVVDDALDADERCAGGERTAGDDAPPPDIRAVLTHADVSSVGIASALAPPTKRPRWRDETTA
ncbi:hypothetical protein SAMN06297387_106141 [Streptomyces zhaozhouensis]|uniref:Uncharacterized protein n=1 Tax=Streptomyces zhaozhouensis TaxID=1300267 RepID=A0A286DVG6_9ACTN|nr:hypothetical protein [Streptomyces zhaozhouensis]SOD62564.1 hypothetical protein SAMN06297387_106141 [Streptomyces zhaozhouensis]